VAAAERAHESFRLIGECEEPLGRTYRKAQFALAMHAGLTFSIPAAAASTVRGEGVRGRTAR
jgi:hypothetical protein